MGRSAIPLRQPLARLRAALWLALDGQPRAMRWWRGLLLVLLCVVTVLALAPGNPQFGPPGADKLNHLAAFSALALVASLAHAGAMAPVAGGLLAYGGLIELLQSLTPTRTADWSDLAADGVGIVLGLAAMLSLARLVRPAAARR
jgi:VanZ family protein